MRLTFGGILTQFAGHYARNNINNPVLIGEERAVWIVAIESNSLPQTAKKKVLYF